MTIFTTIFTTIFIGLGLFFIMCGILIYLGYKEARTEKNPFC